MVPTGSFGSKIKLTSVSAPSAVTVVVPLPEYVSFCMIPNVKSADFVKLKFKLPSL